MPSFLVHFAQRHCTFRLPELASVAKCLGIPLKCNSIYQDSSPFLVIDLPDLEKAILLASRCALVKGIGLLLGESSICLKDLANQVLSSHFPSSFKSYKFQYSSHGRKICKSIQDQLEIFSLFSCISPAFQSVPIVLDDAKVEAKFCIYEDFSSPSSYRAYFCQWICEGARDQIHRLSLKSRPYIGTTSMDAELSLVMANMGCSRPGALIMDPFAGTGSLLVACSALGGAFTLGSEIDGRQLRGGATFDKSQRPLYERPLDGRGQFKIVKKANFDWMTNVVHYGLEKVVLDAIISDISHSPFRSSIEGLLDAIVTDPPYGVRAGTKKASIGSSTIQAYHIDSIIFDLLNFAARMLKIGGRLVFWLPIPKTATPAIHSQTPMHPSMRVICESEQPCGGWSRRLVTMEKDQPYIYLENSFPQGPTFREKIYNNNKPIGNE